jgi:predicted nucleotidyltransferase component of viral defense system
VITKAEIEAKSNEFGIHISNVERDYVFGWILAAIYSHSPLGDSLVLKGGNCFRKAYFPNARFSNDLDFSSASALNSTYLVTELNKICDFVQDRAGVTFEKDRNRVEEKNNSDNEKKIYEARLYFQDFYGNPHTITISVRLDITQFDRIYLPVQSRFIIHPFSDADQCNVSIRCQKLEELLASKLKCLLQRRHSFDLYDYVYSIFINRDIDVNRTEIVRTFLKKTIFERSPGVARGLLLELPFEVFRAIWDKYIVCPKQSLIDFDTALTRFKENITELFGHFRLDYYGSIAFFPAQIRNTIMESASKLTLMELLYDGHPRIVEPYSLVFKQRKDGFGQEYFYAYDRTGGRASGPGIKTFLYLKIQSIKATTTTFEPRYPVELSKAGEFAGKTFFGSSFGSAHRTARTSRCVSNTSRIYIVECSYCQKRFPRKKYSTRLRRHKDKYGNPCYGRSGFMAY